MSADSSSSASATSGERSNTRVARGEKGMSCCPLCTPDPETDASICSINSSVSTSRFIKAVRIRSVACRAMASGCWITLKGSQQDVLRRHIHMSESPRLILCLPPQCLCPFSQRHSHPIADNHEPSLVHCRPCQYKDIHKVLNNNHLLLTSAAFAGQAVLRNPLQSHI